MKIMFNGIKGLFLFLLLILASATAYSHGHHGFGGYSRAILNFISAPAPFLPYLLRKITLKALSFKSIFCSFLNHDTFLY